MKKFKIGLLSAGRFATRRLLPHFKNHPEAELHILHNRSLEKAHHLAHQFNIPHVTHIEREVLNIPSLDGVIICSPNFLHKNLILKALEKGLAVWVEKPPALNTHEVKEILDLFPSPPMMVGQCYRFKKVIQVARQKIEEGLIGALKSIDCHMHMTIPQRGWRATHRYGGGVLLELGIHLIDTLHYLSSEKIEEVFALGNNLEDDEKLPVIWEFKALGKTDQETLVNLSASFEAPYSTGFQVMGTKGTLRGEFVFRGEDDDKEKLTFKNLNEEIENILLEPHNIYREELSHFCEICAGHPSPLSLEQGYENMKVLDALKQSLETQRAVEINRALAL